MLSRIEICESDYWRKRVVNEILGGNSQFII